MQVNLVTGEWHGERSVCGLAECVGGTRPAVEVVGGIEDHIHNLVGHFCGEVFAHESEGWYDGAGWVHVGLCWCL